MLLIGTEPTRPLQAAIRPPTLRLMRGEIPPWFVHEIEFFRRELSVKAAEMQFINNQLVDFNIAQRICIERWMRGHLLHVGRLFEGPHFNPNNPGFLVCMLWQDIWKNVWLNAKD